jgi:hypothetical protein
MEEFPDAVVILNTREPEKWFESWQHLWSACDAVNDPDKIVRHEKFMPFVYEMRNRLFGNQFERESNIATFEKHNEAVRRDVPADRLLEFSVKEGWQPLCKFLNVDVPGTEFPHLNEREGLVDMFKMVFWSYEPVTMF